MRLADSYLNSFTSVDKRKNDFFLIQILIVKRHGKMPMLILFWVRLPLVFAYAGVTEQRLKVNGQGDKGAL